MLDYTTNIPNHPDWGHYSKAVYMVLRAVETGELGPEDAFNTLLAEVKRLLGDEIIIED